MQDRSSPKIQTQIGKLQKTHSNEKLLDVNDLVEKKLRHQNFSDDSDDSSGVPRDFLTVSVLPVNAKSSVATRESGRRLALAPEVVTLKFRGEDSPTASSSISRVRLSTSACLKKGEIEGKSISERAKRASENSGSLWKLLRQTIGSGRVASSNFHRALMGELGASSR